MKRKKRISQMPLIHALKKKTAGGEGLVSARLFSQSTWASFTHAANGKRVVLYGTGDMFDYFCSAYCSCFDIAYAVDKNIASGQTAEKNGITIYSLDMLEKKQPPYVVLITIVNGADTVTADLARLGIQQSFSFPAMEYHRVSVRAKVWLARIWRPYTRSYQKQWKIDNLEQRLASLEHKSAVQRKRQTEGDRYLQHTNRVLNALIDKSGDDELKKEQMRYLFRNIHKNAYDPNFENPRTCNEKLLAMTLYDHNPLYTEVTDKYTFKKYVAEKIGAEYVVPLLGVWDRPEDIDFSQLPEQFVLKATCGGDSREVIIIKNKSAMDRDRIIEEMRPWVQKYHNGYFYNFNWPFKEIKQRIIAEEYIGDEQADFVYDYKLFCFHGRMEVFSISTVEFLSGQPEMKITYMDKNWQKIHLVRNHMDVDDMTKPAQYDKIVEIAEKLAAPFPFVRVDFMLGNGKLYVGELTLTPGGAVLPFNPVSFDFDWGSMI